MLLQDSLQMKIARSPVKAFVDYSSQAGAEPEQVLDALDCDAYLQLGIDAFDWLVRADQQYRKLVFSDELESSPEFEAALEVLFRSWVPPRVCANRWIADVEKRGHGLQNVAEFRKREVDALSIVRFLDSDELTPAMQALRDRALAEFGNGETAEFILS